MRAGSARREQVSSVVLLRDVVRAARRPQTYALRAAFAAVLMGFFGLVWAVATLGPRLLDAASLGKIARYLFVAYAVVQVVVASLVAAFGAAAAVIEERDQNTVDLLMLTRLTARQVLHGKIVARLLVVATVVLGALPVLALITTLGGVSPVEVVAVTVHALVAVFVLGSLGGFFAIFTRSPVFASLAALAWGAVTFLLVPLVYSTLTGDWHGSASFSPLYGTAARNWWALLPVVTYLPVVLMLKHLGARFYELRISRARIESLFRPGAWRVRGLGVLAIGLGVTMLTVLPLAMTGAWFYAVSWSRATPALWQTAAGWLSRGFVWAWGTGALVVATWGYLRVGMDLVLITDDMLGPRPGRPFRARGPARVWGNPVTWRALRGHGWRATGPGLAIWLLVLVGIFQTGLWVIPGGLLGWGAVNAVGGLVLTVWLAVGTIEVERRTGTLEVLLASPMSSVSILLGKVIGVAAPTLLVLVVSVPLILVGVPHLHLLFVAKSGIGWERVLAESVAAVLWVGGLWLFVLVGSLHLALRLARPGNGYAIGVVSLAVWLLVPSVLAGLTRGSMWSEPFRLLVPVLVARPTPWETLLSLGGLVAASIGLFAWSCVKLRTWGLRRG